MSRDRSQISEFGDFQTPVRLAESVCRLLVETVPHPSTIIEPTCGVGNFLFAALRAFPGAQQAFGLDINPQYVSEALRRKRPGRQHVDLVQGDFFATQWVSILSDCRDPVLVIGNPPWVTNTHLSKLGSQNIPDKSNRNGLSGYDAISGKSNFDISEWMLVRLLNWLNGRAAVVAMLCKTSVARKVLAEAWRSQVQLQSASMYLIDARESFGVSVDACLLVCVLAPTSGCNTCQVFPNLSSRSETSKIGYIDGYLVADVDRYLRWRGLLGAEARRWRSGVKHDCSDVMELRRTATGYLNGLGEGVDIEEDYVFPLFKSSDVANGRLAGPKRHLLVPQRRVGDDTRIVAHLAPRTWRYLESHASRLDSRRSTVYARQPRFAVFGVGDYTFAPWKVAVSGLYKQLLFGVVPPFGGKPSVLDDTCYFLACDSQEEALYLEHLLHSEPAQEFYASFLFTDSKRPITVDLLRRLSLVAVARELRDEEHFARFPQSRGGGLTPVQPALFG